jgi:hypothetical protein
MIPAQSPERRSNHRVASRHINAVVPVAASNDGTRMAAGEAPKTSIQKYMNR